MRWGGNVACMDDITNACKILVGKFEWKRQPGGVGMDERVILKHILKK
jgi:hypothetical protein